MVLNTIITRSDSFPGRRTI